MFATCLSSINSRKKSLCDHPHFTENRGPEMKQPTQSHRVNGRTRKGSPCCLALENRLLIGELTQKVGVTIQREDTRKAPPPNGIIHQKHR